MSGQPSPSKSADAAASVQRVLPTPMRSVTSSKRPPPRLRKSRFFPPFVGELEALVHDPRRREVPQIDVAEVGGDVEIEQAVAVVVEPDRAVAVHPATEAGALGDVLEAAAVDVAEQREVAVAIDQHVLAAVVVDVAPDGAHRDAFARAIEVGEPGRGGDVLEGAVAAVAVERVGLAEPAVREVEVRPAVAVEVGDRDGGAERRDVGLDARDLRVERRALVDEADAGLGGGVAQDEARTRSVGGGPNGTAVEAHGEQDRGHEWDGHDGASGRRARAGDHARNLALGLAGGDAGRRADVALAVG